MQLLLACVRARVRLNVTGKDGVPVRDKLRKRLQQAQRDGNSITEITERLAEPPVPPAGRYLWEWFWDLDASRQVGMAPGAISYQEILAWSELTGNLPTPTECGILRAMDRVRLSEAMRASPAEPASAESAKAALAPLINSRKPKSTG